MNSLRVGFNRQIEPPEKGGFIFIDDEVRDLPGTRLFDWRRHSFNPLQDIDERKARDLAELIYALYPQGETTLTVRNGRIDLAPALKDAKRLDEVTGSEEIDRLIGDLMFSPVLRRVLCRKPNFYPDPKAKIMARLNRAELGDRDALALGFFLMAQFKGTVVLPDAGFYLRDAHVSLIRENRLIAGVNYLGELPEKLRSAALLIDDKQASGATFEDAETLARFAGLRKDRNDYNDFVKDAMA